MHQYQQFFAKFHNLFYIIVDFFLLSLHFLIYQLYKFFLHERIFNSTSQSCFEIFNVSCVALVLNEISTFLFIDKIVSQL